MNTKQGDEVSQKQPLVAWPIEHHANSFTSAIRRGNTEMWHCTFMLVEESRARETCLLAD